MVLAVLITAVDVNEKQIVRESISCELILDKIDSNNFEKSHYIGIPSCHSQYISMETYGFMFFWNFLIPQLTNLFTCNDRQDRLIVRDYHNM